jgi:hypothetical protein
METIVKKGARIGVGSELPRTPAVFEAKEKWALKEVSSRIEEMRFEEKFRDNYSTAVDHMQAVKQQVADDVNIGRIVVTSKREARDKFKDRLVIASIGAVPKDLEWSELRVVFDGTNGIQVNSRIRLKDRQRFPLVDDAEALLRTIGEEHRGLPRLGLVYDVKGAHRLVPTDERDQGSPAHRTGGAGWRQQ